MLFSIIMALLMLLVGLMALSEIRTFRRKRGAQRLRRLTLRLSMAGMVIFLLASLLVGVQIFHLQEPYGVTKLWIAFWGCITLLTGGIFCLVIADFHSIGTDVQEDTKQYWEEFMKTIKDNKSPTSKD